MREWLETDGLGGFASGCGDGIATRRYHALLISAAKPPEKRQALVNAVEVHAVSGTARTALSSHRYAPDVIHPDGASRIRRFHADPWPTWSFQLDDGTAIEHELFAVKGAPIVVLRWTLVSGGSLALEVRPLLSGRDLHATHHENGAFQFEPEVTPRGVRFRPYADVQPILLRASGGYTHAPDWYRGFRYSDETARGLDDREDLASPGAFRFELTPQRTATLVLAAEGAALDAFLAGDETGGRLDGGALREAELARRAALADGFARAATDFVVRREQGWGLVAGYPWFGEWGRDTCIALRGLLLARGANDAAGAILRQWASAVDAGMLPNRYPEDGGAPEFNSVDASLWFAIAVHDFEQATGRADPILDKAVLAIVRGYRDGARCGIAADGDGLLRCGESGSQITWMDARVGGVAVTPRVGKPVEVNALWLNALLIAGRQDGALTELYHRGFESFRRRFWNGVRGFLFDVIDVDHEKGRNDPSLRPNQLLAIGGLPLPILSGTRARKVVDACERELLTPLGLRTLARFEPGYRATCEGGPEQRDAAYHQGTVWPWLIGPFVDAWIRVRGDTAAAREQARERFVEPLLRTAADGGFHLTEIADAEAPHHPRGAPFQAWSLGELLRARAATA